MPTPVPTPVPVPALDEVLAVLDGWFDPRWAEPWDAVGLVCGDPDQPVERILLAVDAVPDTVTEAIAFDAQLLVTHHPLLLTAVHGVPVTDPKGSLVHRLIRAGTAHLVAHTNADVAAPGVSDALAGLLGVGELQPLDPQDDAPADKLVAFVPVAAVEGVVDALAAAGAGRLGDYDRCAWTATGEGTFRPLAGAHPAVGTVDAIERVAEARVEMLVPHRVRADVLAALRRAHPYEEPAFDLLAQSPLPSRRGTGRIGRLAATTTLAAFTRLVAQRLPATAWGVRAAGEPGRPIRTVAVCGGSGGSLAATARRLGADVLVTSDLKHHPGVEQVTERGPGTMALIDAAHWATESPWLDVLAARLTARFGTTVEVRVSRHVTDPWTLHADRSGALTGLEGRTT